MERIGNDRPENPAGADEQQRQQEYTENAMGQHGDDLLCFDDDSIAHFSRLHQQKALSGVVQVL